MESSTFPEMSFSPRNIQNFKTFGGLLMIVRQLLIQNFEMLIENDWEFPSFNSRPLKQIAYIQLNSNVFFALISILIEFDWKFAY